jgi:hypothetical protein
VATPAKLIASGLRIRDYRRSISRKSAKFGRFVSGTPITARSQMSKVTQLIGSGLARMTNMSESFLVDSKSTRKPGPRLAVARTKEK